MHEIIDLLKTALQDPWMLLFLAVWGLGYFLKEFSTLDSKKIPWIVLPFGIVLGVFLVELSAGGAIIGGVMALAQMGLYDVIKPMLTGGPKINTHNGI